MAMINLTEKKITSAEGALEAIDANFSVSKIGMITENGIDVPNNFAIIRNDVNKVLGVVGNRYEPVQNSDSFAIMDVLSEHFNASYSYGSIFRDGGLIVLQASIGEYEVRKGDVISTNLTMVNSHDGTTPMSLYFTPIRLFCKNQLRASFKTATNKVTIRHTASAGARLEEAMRIYGLGIEYFDIFKDRAKTLANKIMDAEMVKKFLDEFVGDSDRSNIKERRETVERLYHTGKGNGKGSLWDMYNAVTEYTDHFRYADSDKSSFYATIASGDVKEDAWKMLETFA